MLIKKLNKMSRPAMLNAVSDGVMDLAGAGRLPGDADYRMKAGYGAFNNLRLAEAAGDERLEYTLIGDKMRMRFMGIDVEKCHGLPFYAIEIPEL